MRSSSESSSSESSDNIISSRKFKDELPNDDISRHRLDREGTLDLIKRVEILLGKSETKQQDQTPSGNTVYKDLKRLLEKAKKKSKAELVEKEPKSPPVAPQVQFKKRRRQRPLANVDNRAEVSLTTAPAALSPSHSGQQQFSAALPTNNSEEWTPASGKEGSVISYTAAPPRDGESSTKEMPLGFGELCRFFKRELRKDFDEITADNMASMMIECWKCNNYLYSDLEDMYLVNMQHNQDREMLARELAHTFGTSRENFPSGVTSNRLVNLTIQFFNTEPRVMEKLRHILEQEKFQVDDRSASISSQDDTRRRRNTKYEGLKPVTLCIGSLLEQEGLNKHRADQISSDITERLVIAGYAWDRILQYHSKGLDKFRGKLIPHVFMSKDSFPHGLTSEDILAHTFQFIEGWKTKLFELLSSGTAPAQMTPWTSKTNRPTGKRRHTKTSGLDLQHDRALEDIDHPLDEEEDYGKPPAKRWVGKGGHKGAKTFHSSRSAGYEGEPWRRPRRPSPADDDVDREGDQSYSPPLSPPAKLTAKKQQHSVGTATELEQRKQLKERWNKEYDKRVSARGDSLEQGREWAALPGIEYYSSNDDSGRPVSGRHFNDHLVYDRNGSDQDEGVHRYRATLLPSYPYDLEKGGNKGDENPHYHIERQHQAKLRRHYSHTDAEPAGFHQPYLSDDDPRDVDTRQHRSAVPAALGVAQLKPGFPARVSRPPGGGPVSKPAYRGGRYASAAIAASASLPGYDLAMGKKKDSKTTYYHYDSDEDDATKVEKTAGRRASGRYRSPSPLFHRDQSRESVSSVTSADGQPHLVPKKQPRSNRPKEAGLREMDEKAEPRDWSRMKRKLKHEVSENSSEEEKPEDWKEKQRLQKRRKTKKKPQQMSKLRPSHEGHSSSQSSSRSSSSSRHTSVDRRLEKQQPQVKHEPAKSASEEIKKGSLLSKVTEILNSCMDLKPPIKRSPKKSIPALKQREQKGSKDVAAAFPSPVDHTKPKQKSNIINNNNNKEQLKEEAKAYHPTAQKKEPSGIKMEAKAHNPSVQKKEPPAPVPPPSAACLLVNKPAVSQTVKKEDGGASTTERPPSLEDGEIHGTDADDIVFDMEDNIMHETDLKGALQVEQKIAKKESASKAEGDKKPSPLSQPSKKTTLADKEEAREAASGQNARKNQRPSPAASPSRSRSRSRSQSSRESRKGGRKYSRSRSQSTPPRRSRSRSSSRGSRRQHRSSSRSRSRSSSARSWRKPSKKVYRRSSDGNHSRSPLRRSHTPPSPKKRRTSRSWSPRRSSRSPPPHHSSYHHNSGGNARYQNSQHHSSSTAWYSAAAAQKRQQWIPVTPATATETVEIDPLGTVLVRIAAKGEFSFRDNAGAMVRVTKWTGRDAVPHIQIRPQVVALDENSACEIEIYNPMQSKRVPVAKYDKVACISVLSCPPSSEMYDAMDSPAPDMEAPRRWFKVSAVVLHRKGTLDRITIQPGRSMKVIATIIGPIKKYIGKEVMISALKNFDEFPVEPQITRICDNENVGIMVKNRGRNTLRIDKAGQEVAALSVWANVKVKDVLRR